MKVLVVSKPKVFTSDVKSKKSAADRSLFLMGWVKASRKVLVRYTADTVQNMEIEPNQKKVVF